MTSKNLWAYWTDAKALVDGHKRPDDESAGELYDFLADGGFDMIEYRAVLRAKEMAREQELFRLKKLRERINPLAVDATWLNELDTTITGLKRSLKISTAADEETKRIRNRERVAEHRRRKKEQAAANAAEEARRAAMTPLERLREDHAYAVKERDLEIEGGKIASMFNANLASKHIKAAHEWADKAEELEKEIARLCAEEQE